MKEIWALSLVIMAALTLVGGVGPSFHFPSIHMKTNNGLTLVCPRYHILPASETFCVVNITYMKELNCVHPDGMINVFHKPGGSTNCMIDANSGRCVSSPSCKDCHSDDGLETRVYFTEALYDDSLAFCSVTCPPNPRKSITSYSSYPCYMYSRRVAVVRFNQKHDIRQHPLQVRTMCPRRSGVFYESLHTFPYHIPCRVSLTTLKQGLCQSDRHLEVHEVIERQSNKEGVFFKPRNCTVDPHWGTCSGEGCNCTLTSGGEMDVTFSYSAKDARLGLIVTSCEVRCRDAYLKVLKQASDTSCTVQLTNPAYAEDTSRVEDVDMSMLCPLYIPKLPVYLTCKLNIDHVKHRYSQCFTPDEDLVVEENRILYSETSDGSGYMARERSFTKCIIHKDMRCDPTDSCPYCERKGNVFRIGFRYSAQAQKPFLMYRSECEIQCKGKRNILSNNSCVVYFNPVKPFDDEYD